MKEFNEEIRAIGSPQLLFGEEIAFAQVHDAELASEYDDAWEKPDPLVRTLMHDKRICTAVVLCLWTFCRPIYGQQNSSQTSSSMEHEFQAAMAAQDAGDSRRAEALLLNLHTHHPGIFAVDESLGLVYVARGDYAAALPFFKQAAREQPKSDVAHANFGAALFKLHRNSEALAEFQIAARLNPRNADTQQSLGQLWMETGKPAFAAGAYARALQLKPDDSDLLLAEARAMEQAGQISAAKALIEGWQGAENSATAQSMLGDLDEKAGDYKQAAEHYVKAVNLEPNEANSWMLGVEFLRHWTFDAAVREFQAAVVRFPESTRMKLGLGAAYFGDGEYAKSIPIFADLLQTEKDSALYAELLGMSCTALTREAKPRCSVLLDYAVSHPKDAKASVFAAEQILQGASSGEQMSQARELLKSAMAADTRSSDAFFQMGILQQTQGEWDKSIANLETAIKLKPDLAEAHYRLALAYWRAGRKQEARAQIALQKQFHQQQQNDLDHRLRQITTFLVNVQN